MTYSRRYRDEILRRRSPPYVSSTVRLSRMVARARFYIHSTSDPHKRSAKPGQSTYSYARERVENMIGIKSNMYRNIIPPLSFTG